jgi:SAM-dependent methyltransferase
MDTAQMDPKQANIVYHDYEAEQYDEKWSISYDERCVEYARDRFVRMAGTEGWPYAKVLEIGCGTGLVLLHVAPRCSLYVGTDFSATVLADLGERVAGLPRVRLERRTADDFAGMPERGFDAVVMGDVLEHLTRAGEALDRAGSQLEEGGFEVYGEVLKTAPRGFRRNHARAPLLRHKAVFGGRRLAAGRRGIPRPTAVEHVARTWRDGRVLNAWLDAHLGPSAVPHEDRFGSRRR